MSNPVTVHEALILYMESKRIGFNAKPIRKLLSTLKLYVIPDFGFPSKSLDKPAVCLKKLCLTKFVAEARQVFKKSYEEALLSAKNKATLDNDRSNFKAQ